MAPTDYRLKKVTVTGPASLLLCYVSGDQLSLCLAPTIEHYPTLHTLRHQAVFATAKVADRGRVVRWLNDDQLELAADNLHSLAIEQGAHSGITRLS